MSSTDNVDLEAQIPHSDFPEFDQLVETVSSGLIDINSNIAQLETIMKSLDAESYVAYKEGPAVELADSTRSKFKILSEPIKSLHQWPDSLPAQRFTLEKLLPEFITAFAKFQDVQTELAQWQRSSSARAVFDIADVDDEASGELTDLYYQRLLITQRQDESDDIVDGIAELDEIFTDIGIVVAVEGE